MIRLGFPEKTPQQILNLAADLIDRNGKANGSFITNYGGTYKPVGQCRMCPLGAIGYVTTGDVHGYREEASAGAVRLLMDSLGVERWGSWENERRDAIVVIGDWSDGNSKDDVVARLREVASSEDDA